MNKEPNTGIFERPLTLRTKIGLGVLVAGSLFVLKEMNDADTTREERIEACVSELVDRPIDLVTDPESGMLQRPAGVFEEVTACQRTDADADEAKILLDD